MLRAKHAPPTVSGGRHAELMAVEAETNAAGQPQRRGGCGCGCAVRSVRCAVERCAALGQDDDTGQVYRAKLLERGAEGAVPALTMASSM